MIYNKCGKEIDDDSKFCTECGAEIKAEENTGSETADKAVAATSEAYEEAKQIAKEVGQGAKVLAEKGIDSYKNFKNMSKEEQQEAIEQTKKAKNFADKEKENYKNFKNLSVKQKIVRIAVPVLVLIILVNIFGGGNGNNSYVIKADSGSGFGNVTFYITFEEFIEKYNACVDEDEEYESVAQMRYLKASDFEKNTIDGGTIAYSKNFGYYFGYSFKVLATLYIYVNPNTDTIQFVEYKWRRDGYNNDESEVNYYLTLPATIFSMLDDSVDFPFDDDTSSYKKTYDEIADDGMVVKGDSFYKYLSADDSTHSIVFYAATKNSSCYKANKNA